MQIVGIHFVGYPKIYYYILEDTEEKPVYKGMILHYIKSADSSCDAVIDILNPDVMWEPETINKYIAIDENNNIIGLPLQQRHKRFLQRYAEFARNFFTLMNDKRIEDYGPNGLDEDSLYKKCLL